MNQDLSPAQSNDSINKDIDGKPNWVLVLVLRILSVGVAYGMYLLLQWRENNPNDFPSSIYLMVIMVFIGVLFLLLGAIAPGKVVVSAWKKIGIVLLIFLM